jgi:lipopolysaccharide/colanic/teichoic acid biosynthesis glycosyltransferase
MVQQLDLATRARARGSVDSPGYRLKWRMGQLIVRDATDLTIGATPRPTDLAPTELTPTELTPTDLAPTELTPTEFAALTIPHYSNPAPCNCPALKGRGPVDWIGLVDCLQRSRVTRLKLDLNLSPEMLQLWADAGNAAGKSLYISLPSSPDLPQWRSVNRWRFKRGADRVAAVSLILTLSPLILTLAIWVRRQTQESLMVRDWQIGERGKLYQSLKLRTVTNDGVMLRGANWILRNRLDRLAKLINVVQGDMSLVGACPQRLSESSGYAPQLQCRLNALPGVMGSWILQAHWHKLDLTVIDRLDWTYLQDWSLWQDLRLLVMSLPHWVDDYVDDYV